MNLDIGVARPAASHRFAARWHAVRTDGGRAAGAAAGQLSQALASFVLQLVAARTLGASGLGVFALLYSTIVLGTAVVSGVVGDSLTVLDRNARGIRAGLQSWCVLLSALAGCLAAVGAHLAGLVDWTPAVVFGAAAMVFMLEDTMRRLLMASMRFWMLPIVDLSGLFASLVVLVIGWGAGGGLTLADLLLALLVGQLVAGVVAVPLLPRSERYVVPWRPADLGAVFRYGRWRGMQQAVRPTMLTVARVLVTVALGAALYGQLEAARVYMAPALLLVSGMGSYLLPSYAAGRKRPVQQAIHRADGFAAVLLGGTLLVGVIGTAAAPALGPLVTGRTYHIEALAVFGWAVYAASTAAVLPYGALAAVRGRQAKVVAFRVADSTLSLALAYVVLFVLHASASWTPFALAAGSFVGGAMVRYLILVPLIRVPGPAGGATVQMAAT